MGLISWALGKKPEASGPSPSSSTTKPDKVDSHVKISSRDALSKMVSTNGDNVMVIEELESDDGVLSAEMNSSDERNHYPKAQSSSKTRAKGPVNPTGLIASSSSFSTAELFGGDDTDFLGDLLEGTSAPLKFQRRGGFPLDKGKVSVSQEINKPCGEDGAYHGDASEKDEEPDDGIDVESPAFGLTTQGSLAQSTFPKSTTSEEDEHSNFPSDKDHTNADEDEQDEQPNVILVEEQAAVVKKPSASVILARLHKPIVSPNWADLDEDDDDWEAPVAWRAGHASDNPNVLEDGEEDIDSYVQYNAQADVADLADSEEEADADITERPIDETSLEAEQDNVGSEAGVPSSYSLPTISDYGVGDLGLDNGEEITNFNQSPADETSEENDEELQGAHVGTSCSHYTSSESDYGAGYTGPSRSLAYHDYADVVQAYRNEEDRRDSDEAYQIQMQQLWERYAEKIDLLKEPSTTEPQEQDSHDEVMRIVFSDIYPALPSNAESGQMHIIDWKTLMGPDYLGPDPDDEGKFLLHFAKPRLCDVVATLLFESDPSALDAWLDPSNKVVEWWHSLHHSYPGVFKTVIRRDGNEVTVGTFSDLGFNVCWNRYIKAEINTNGQWSESFAFKGGQFRKQPEENEPGASSRKDRGEIDWESFKIGDPSKYDWDELEDPAEALWQGRVLARELLLTILNNYNQYRGGNTVELVVDGELTPIEARGVRRVPRCNGIENDRIEEVVSSLGVYARIGEDLASHESSSEVLNGLEL
ncbi:uncharacterized protein N0V89_008891 [Didymosphaeria variabile]|uniref:Uncharacterized protein n=1 Tax=Didymosphaeria variabile TaxID=1932322 RepID=A0A9W9C888_9PLEO|nr:uncharacterized protein N0V89_008891 [Didymosphaeria variabile]KAJ4350270.1 hypothetical protein N0V89_008891 [Didymosphaeria variabile]